MTARLLPCVVAGLLVAGCGTQLDGASIEKLLVAELADRGHADAAVNCPDVDNEVGKRFTCAVSGAPGITTVEGSVARNDQIRVDRVS